MLDLAITGFTLAFLADFSFPASRFGPAKIAPLLAYGVLIELVQYFLPHREASWLDVVGDGAAAAAAGINAAPRDTGAGQGRFKPSSLRNVALIVLFDGLAGP